MLLNVISVSVQHVHLGKVMTLQLSDAHKSMVEDEVRRQLSQKEPSSISGEVSGLGGFLLGGGLGLGAVGPVESIVERQTLKKALERNDLYENEEEAYKALRSIFKGEKTFSDFGGASDLLQQLYDDPKVKDMIQDDRAYAETMRKYKFGRLVDIRNANKDIKINNLKRFAPYAGVIDNFSDQIKHPLVSIGGLAGATAGHALYSHYKNKGNNV